MDCSSQRDVDGKLNMNKRNFFKFGAVAGALALLCRKAQAAVLSIGTPMGNVRTANATGITSNTTLASDSVLTVPIAAGATVFVEVFIPFSLAGVLSGYKFGLSLPASPTNVVIVGEVTNAVTGALALSSLVTAGGLVTGGALATSGSHFAKIKGTIENGSNAGSIAVQAAQNTSDSGALTILRGAFIRLTPLN